MKKLKVICNDQKLLPKYNHDTDAALDLYASGEFIIIVGKNKQEIKTDSYPLQPMQRLLVKTGIKIELPKGHWGNIRSRSGLSLNEGIITLGGVIDPDYRGEIGVILQNLSADPVDIKKYDKVAQMLIQTFEHVKVEKVTNLSETKRAQKGFGSSGKK